MRRTACMHTRTQKRIVRVGLTITIKQIIRLEPSEIQKMAAASKSAMVQADPTRRDEAQKALKELERMAERIHDHRVKKVPPYLHACLAPTARRRVVVETGLEVQRRERRGGRVVRARCRCSSPCRKPNKA